MRKDIERDKALQQEYTDKVRAIWENYEPTKLVEYDDIIVRSVASGSKGNCFVVTNNTIDKTWIFDLGVSLKQIRQTISMRGISKVFVTHHHGDHDFGLESALNELPFEVFVLPESNDGDDYKKFPLLHSNPDYSLLDNYAYIYNHVLYLTDFGAYTDELIDWVVDNIDDIHFVIMESNYCKHELWDKPGAHNADRTSSDVGHLSWSEGFYMLEAINKRLMAEGKPIIHNSDNNIIFMTMHLTSSAKKGYGKGCPFDLNARNMLDSKVVGE